MTAGRFSDVDHELLADYLGGALDGTPDEATVARLVREDPAWREAYDTLVPAIRSVRAELADWGARPVPMPQDVVERLEGALADAGPATGAARRAPVSAVPAQLTGGSTHRAVFRSRLQSSQTRLTPRAHRPVTIGGAAARRRRARLAVPLAAAAVVSALAGIGLGQLLGGSGNDNAADTTAGSAESAIAPRAALDPAAQLVATGTDYTPELLGRAQVSADGGKPSANGLGVPSLGGRSSSPPGLARLADRDALAACLDEIATEHARGPVTVSLVDYAAFAGQPALVVRFTDPDGSRWVWVTGPECGVPGSAADTRYRSRVG